MNTIQSLQSEITHIFSSIHSFLQSDRVKPEDKEFLMFAHASIYTAGSNILLKDQLVSENKMNKEEVQAEIDNLSKSIRGLQSELDQLTAGK